MANSEHIIVSVENKNQLQKLGEMGETFNDVVSRLIENNKKGSA